MNIQKPLADNPFSLRVADLTVGVRGGGEALRRFCGEYLSDGEPDFSVTLESGDIAFEQEKDDAEAALEGRPAHRWDVDYLETLALYRKIAERTPFYDTILFHGSAVAVDSAAYLFTAKSGTGKSTHTRLWRECFGERAVMINDDKPLLRIAAEGVVVYGTPWDGKHHLSRNMSAPLKALCILERNEFNCIERVTPETVYPLLLQQTYRPADPAALAETLELLDRLMGELPVYRLGCNMEREAARVAYEGMQK